MLEYRNEQRLYHISELVVTSSLKKMGKRLFSRLFYFFPLRINTQIDREMLQGGAPGGIVCTTAQTSVSLTYTMTCKSSKTHSTSSSSEIHNVHNPSSFLLSESVFTRTLWEIRCPASAHSALLQFIVFFRRFIFSTMEGVIHQSSGCYFVSPGLLTCSFDL
jgi:hypothetical protein